MSEIDDGTYDAVVLDAEALDERAIVVATIEPVAELVQIAL